MAADVEDPQRRYRRRIIGVGAGLFVLTFLLPAPFVLDRVENDLEDRVADELAAAGLDGVTASFSGQDGTLSCDGPLDEPEIVVDLAENEWGVRRVSLDDSCSSAGGEDTDTDSDSDDADGDADDAVAGTEAPSTTVPASDVSTTTTTSLAPEVATITSLIDDDPQFSQFAGLLATSGVDELLSNGASFTVFAPTDAAFDAAFEALGPDAFASLTADETLVEQLVLHHVADGVLTRADLAPGDLDMRDGTVVTIDVTDDGVTLMSGGAVARPSADLSDLPAANGVVHAIDAVLLPADLDLDGAASDAPQLTFTLSDGLAEFGGSVASETQRQVVLAAVDGSVDPANVTDALTLDENATLSDDEVARFTAVVAAVPSTLASGVVTLTGGELAVVGVHLGDEAVVALDAVATEQGAAVEATPRPLADDVTAAELEAELNDVVRADPITFEPNSADLTAESNAIVEQVAGRALAIDGVAILVVGHTDSDGQAATNQVLSEARAATVLDSLVAEGLDPATLTAVGRGDTEPVLVDGVEDKAASRRVEFTVTAAST